MKDVLKLSPSEECKNLEKKFPHTSAELLNILKSMLHFNPYFRPTSRELLKNPVFDKVRIPEAEERAQYKIVL